MSAENPSEAVIEAEPPAADSDAASAGPGDASGKRRVSETAPMSSALSADGHASDTDGYRVSLPMFEGPLDLLLHLVQKHELDILDIPIAFITEKYTAYIRLLDELNIDLASEYLVMAATLVHIKSRMLLPNAPVDDEDAADEEELDPRADLVRRLLEYQKYKNAAEELAQRSITGKDVFPRGSPLEAVGGQMPLMAVSMFQLIDVFQSVLERTAQTRQHEIDFERFSISEKITELLERLRGERRIEFSQIFSGDRNRGEIIVTFLALLEMTRLRLTWLFQEGPLEPIFVELRATDEEAAEADVAASEASFAPPPARPASEEESSRPTEALLDESELEELDVSDVDADLDLLELDDTESAPPDEVDGALGDLAFDGGEQAELEPEPVDLRAPEPAEATSEAEPSAIATEEQAPGVELSAAPSEEQAPGAELEEPQAELQAPEAEHAPEEVTPDVAVTAFEAAPGAIEPDGAKPEVDVLAPEAETVAIEAETVAIEAETVAIEAETVAIEAETVAIEAETVAIEGETSAGEAEQRATERHPVEVDEGALEPKRAQLEQRGSEPEPGEVEDDPDARGVTSNDTGVEQP